MKKEDLLLVFEFLATALKPDVVEEKSVEPIKEIYEDYDYVGNVLNKKPEVDCEKTKHIEEIEKSVEKAKSSTGTWLEDVVTELNPSKPKPIDKFVNTLKTDSERIKEIMTMIEGSKVYVKSKPETEIEKTLKDYQRNIASQISLLEANIRDSLATPEQRKLFREFVKMENFKANKDLDRIGYFLDNPGIENPFEGKDEDPKPEAKIDLKTSEVGDLKIPVLDDLIKKSTVPQIIKDVMVRPSVPTSISVKVEDGQVKFKEEFKHGLGPNKKFGFDGQEIKE